MKHLYRILYCIQAFSFFTLHAELNNVGFDFQSAHERKMVVVVPSYNNARYVQQNLDSIFSQEYINYRVIYIDDCSSDDTFEQVKKYVTERKLWDKVKLIHNTHRHGALYNLYHTIHSCKDYEVVVKVDGDDALAHSQVLTRLNRAYANSNTWLTYGQFQFYPQAETGYCGQISCENHSNIRQQCGLATHLCTFYAGLFKKIETKDLLYDGRFFAVTSDKAIMAPMLEMANGRWEFIQDVLYIYNFVNPLSDATLHGAEQVRMRDYIMQMPQYQPLQGQLPFERARADMVIFSYDRPLQLYALIESLEKYVAGLGHITVIYRTSDERFSNAYEQVKTRFACVEFKKQGDNPQTDFKQLTIESSFNTSNPYIIYAVDDIICKDCVDITECIRLLEKHRAYGFYLRLGKNLSTCYTNNQPQKNPKSRQVKNGVYEWRFCEGEWDWSYPNTVDMTLYRKKDIESYMHHVNYTTPNTLEGEWAGLGQHFINHMGLYCRESKIVNIPLNRVGEYGNRHMNYLSSAEMLQIFEAGKKIDIQPLFRVRNTGAHTPYVPKFVDR